MIPAVERVGVIGAGGAARIHLQALRRTDGIRVVGILDLDPGRAAALAAEFGLPCELANPARFYHEGRPQSVHIVTPPDAHEDLAAEALDRGLHVLVEKPPALTAAGCRALLRQAGARRLTVGVKREYRHASADPAGARRNRGRSARPIAAYRRLLLVRHSG
jgi:predicted dehydrogenase